MKNKIKITVAGIGGVGGYFGGLLANRFYQKDGVEICFFARGEHLKQIQKKGLKVIKGTTEFVAIPSLASDNASEIGIADFILICTKSYDLETVLLQLKPCIDSHTVLLPLLNGVDSTEIIKGVLPTATVLDGCAYIVSSLKEPGVIENSGNIQTLYFGLNNKKTDKLVLLEEILRQATIEAILSDGISSIIWEKFIFISPTATATSYFNNCIGELLADENKSKMLQLLIEEITQIAKSKGILIDKEITAKTLNKLKSLPFETTSSMHRDFKNHKKKTEVESLTGYVVRAGQQLNILTPEFERAYNQLRL